MTERSVDAVRAPSVAQALVPIGLLVALLAASVALFGEDSSGGPNQIALILAAGAGASYDGLQRGNGTFSFSASPNPGVSLEQLEQGFLAEVRKIAEQPPSAEEMDRVRAGVLAGQVFQRDSVMGQAMELGRLSVLGVDWRLAERFDENLEKVTPEQVQQAARDWLVAERGAVAYVYPPESPAEAPQSTRQEASQ